MQCRLPNNQIPQYCVCQVSPYEILGKNTIFDIRSGTVRDAGGLKGLCEYDYDSELDLSNIQRNMMNYYSGANFDDPEFQKFIRFTGYLATGLVNQSRITHIVGPGGCGKTYFTSMFSTLANARKPKEARLVFIEDYNNEPIEIPDSNSQIKVITVSNDERVPKKKWAKVLLMERDPNLPLFSATKAECYNWLLMCAREFYINGEKI